MIGKDLLGFYWRVWKYRLFKDNTEIKILLDNLRPKDVAIDIGVYKGIYAYWASRKVGKSGRVYAFEPQKNLCNYLQNIINLAKIKNITLEPIGLSSQKGEMCLSVPEGNKGYSQLATFENISNEKCETYNVQVDTLDGYCKKMNINSVKFIKCDVEGHELEVFKGGIEVLKKHKPMLLFECEQRHLHKHRVFDVFSFLKQLGYYGQFVWKNKLLPIEEFKFNYHQVKGKKDYANNFLFLTKTETSKH